MSRKMMMMILKRYRGRKVSNCAWRHLWKIPVNKSNYLMVNAKSRYKNLDSEIKVNLIWNYCRCCCCCWCCWCCCCLHFAKLFPREWSSDSWISPKRILLEWSCCCCCCCCCFASSSDLKIKRKKLLNDFCCFRDF